MSPSEHDIQKLYEYCASKNITIHPSIRPRLVPGCGLGVYSTEAIGSDEELVRVPVSEIFTTECIPEEFLGRDAREGIAVHAQLAAFFAFGGKTDLEPYDAWLATWPVFEDFFGTMPLFWGNLLANLLERCREDDNETAMSQSPPPAKKQRVHDGSLIIANSSATSVAHMNGAREVHHATNLQSLSIIHGQVIQMAEKLVSHVHSIHVVLPKLQILRDSEKLTKFFHAWCLVNTRCFYYLQSLSSRSKQKAPEDPNEAMGLCPFMDLFNHVTPSPGVELSCENEASSQKPCKVSSGIKGFTTTTKSEISANKEILFSYGPHTNDTLWSEYGFLLPGSSNSSDSVLLDQVILQHITKDQSQTLEHHDYFASYTLFNDGSVCYRTEMVAWLFVIGISKWTRCVEEGLDPADFVEAGDLAADEHQRIGRNGTRSRPVLSPVRRHQQIIEGWLTALQQQAQENTKALELMEDTDILEVYTTLSIINATIEDESAEKELSFARRRHKMCISRCEQISAMAARGVEASISGSIGDV